MWIPDRHEQSMKRDKIKKTRVQTNNYGDDYEWEFLNKILNRQKMDSFNALQPNCKYLIDVMSIMEDIIMK